jgi:hypothetical protein
MLKRAGTQARRLKVRRGTDNLEAEHSRRGRFRGNVTINRRAREPVDASPKASDW